MKSNEIFIIGGAILAAILLFKGQASSSISGSIPFINPFSNLLSKAEAQAINQFGSNIETLQSVKQSNLGIAQSILDLERNTADVKISQVQTELDKVQGYIGSQQKFASSAAFASLAPPQQGWQNNAQALLRKFIGVSAGNSLFPDFRLISNQQNYDIVQQQAQFETAQGNIGKANEFAIRQQGEIDRLNEEYQTRFGGISRYG
jgi:hypothetical protein